MLLRLVEHHKLPAGAFATHTFRLDQVDEAYETFAHAADTKALKVVMTS